MGKVAGPRIRHRLYFDLSPNTASRAGASLLALKSAPMSCLMFRSPSTLADTLCLVTCSGFSLQRKHDEKPEAMHARPW